MALQAQRCEQGDSVMPDTKLAIYYCIYVPSSYLRGVKCILWKVSNLFPSVHNQSHASKFLFVSLQELPMKPGFPSPLLRIGNNSSPSTVWSHYNILTFKYLTSFIFKEKLFHQLYKAYNTPKCDSKEVASNKDKRKESELEAEVWMWQCITFISHHWTQWTAFSPQRTAFHIMPTLSCSCGQQSALSLQHLIAAYKGFLQPLQ